MRSPERLLIVGTGVLARKIVEEIRRQKYRFGRIVRIADEDAARVDPCFTHLLAGPLNRLPSIIEEVRPEHIVVALDDRRGRLPVRDLLDARVRGIPVEDAVDVYERLTGKIAIESLTPSNLIASKDFRKSHFDLASAHVISVIASLVGLLLLAPLFAGIALAIALESRGPVFFVQNRVGRGGRPFKLIKFRTMRPTEGTHTEWAGDNRDRITRVGRWLRKFRLDELPQLVNVVKGEMNLVGPRPHPVCNFEWFSQTIPYYSLRAIVRPGLTGWAQVCQGYANSLEEETEKMRYDLYYIKHMSVWLDLRILWSTIWTVLNGRESTNNAAASRRVSPLVPSDIRWVVPASQTPLRKAFSDRVAAARTSSEIQALPPAV
jgi:exopolysaccharide biosynthesis polyprenyl glycosylphosphotransferase